MPTTYTTRLASVERCGADIVLATLELPEGYSYRAGQWFRLTLQTADGPDSRTLSHAAAPSDEAIAFGTRLSPTPYKQALGRLREGDEVEVSGPGGRLRLPEDDVPLAFLAGGVGITPIRSLIRDAVATGRGFSSAVLLYGNRDESCIPYRGEFEGFAEKGLEVVHVLERPPAGWNQEDGFITSETIRRHMEPEGRTFVVSGPPVMVDAMERLLDELAVPSDARIVERFGPRT